MKTYALLVGLDQYQDRRIPQLAGCVNDVTRFETYLKTSLFVPEKQILKLTNAQATKATIVAGFQSHLAQATRDDVVIFYFAGHGIKQAANPVFKAGSLNDAMECMTCNDTTLTGSNLIADKELRWLINQLATKSQGCHILTIFDCCHSGDNTRDIGEPSTLKKRALDDIRGREFIMPMRPWNEFLFSKTISEKAVETNDLEAILPQGAHIQLAACASNETAKEKDGRGLFSKYLVELLESSGGKMTYYDLRSLTYRRLADFPPVNRQTPQFYAVDQSLFQPFLGGAAQTEIQANVSFSKTRNQWEMAMGSIYGITKGAKVFVNLPNNKGQEGGVVGDVFQDYSVLTFDIEGFEDKKGIADKDRRILRTQSYKCNVGKFMQKEIKVACVSKTATAAWTQYTKSKVDLLANALIKPVDAAAKPDFVLNTEGSLLFFADPKTPTRPLVRMIDFKNPDDAFGTLVEQLVYVTRWHFVKTQSTADNSLFDNLQVTFEHDGKVDDLKNADKAAFKIASYNTREVGELHVSGSKVTIAITNKHPTNTQYVAGIFLSEFFGIDTTAINQNSLAMPLEPGKTFYVYGGAFRFSFRDNVLVDKWDKLSNILKVYTSTNPFDLTQLCNPCSTFPRSFVNNINLPSINFTVFSTTLFLFSIVAALYAFTSSFNISCPFCAISVVMVIRKILAWPFSCLIFSPGAMLDAV